MKPEERGLECQWRDGDEVPARGLGREVAQAGLGAAAPFGTKKKQLPGGAAK